MKLLTSLVCASLLGISSQAPSNRRTEYVSFCDVSNEPEKYDQTSITTSGIYAAGPEFAVFIDPACPPTTQRDNAAFPTPIDSAVQRSQLWQRMGQIIDRDQQAFVVVRGVFDAYKRYEGRLPDDPKLQEILKIANSRFGHLNFARFRLRIESVEFVSAVSSAALP